MTGATGFRARTLEETPAAFVLREDFRRSSRTSRLYENGLKLWFGSQEPPGSPYNARTRRRMYARTDTCGAVRMAVTAVYARRL